MSRRKHACDSAKTYSCLGEDKVVFRRRHGEEVCFKFDKDCVKFHEIYVRLGKGCVRFHKGCVRFREVCVRFREVRIIINKV